MKVQDTQGVSPGEGERQIKTDDSPCAHYAHYAQVMSFNHICAEKSISWKLIERIKSEFHPIPKFRELLPIPEWNGKPRNPWEFRAIACNSLSTQFPEFLTEIAYLSRRLILDHNGMREVRVGSNSGAEFRELGGDGIG
jgi:hypothetical protein